MTEDDCIAELERIAHALDTCGSLAEARALRDEREVWVRRRNEARAEEDERQRILAHVAFHWGDTLRGLEQHSRRLRLGTEIRGCFLALLAHRASGRVPPRLGPTLVEMAKDYERE